MVIKRNIYKRSNTSGGAPTAYDPDTIPPRSETFNPADYTVHIIVKDILAIDGRETIIHDLLEGVGYTCDYTDQDAVSLGQSGDDTILNGIADFIIILDTANVNFGASFKTIAIPLLVCGSVSSILEGNEMTDGGDGLQASGTTAHSAVYEGADFPIGIHNWGDDSARDYVTIGTKFYYVDEAGTPGSLAAGAVELIRDASDFCTGFFYPKGSTMHNSHTAPAARLFFGLDGQGPNRLIDLSKMLILQFVKYGIENNV